MKIDPSELEGIEPTPEATEELKAAVQEAYDLDIEIAELNRKLEQKTKDHEFTSSELRRRIAQINSFEGALKNNEWDFDFETLSDLASYFDIELSREYDVTITLRFSGTVTAPMNFDMDDIENFLDIRIDTDYRTSDLTVDLYQDDFDLDYTEA